MTDSRIGHCAKSWIPQRWLGVGAVSLGLGMAMAAGTGAAQADVGGTDSAAPNSAETKASGESSAPKPAPRQRSASMQARSVRDSAALPDDLPISEAGDLTSGMSEPALAGATVDDSGAASTPVRIRGVDRAASSPLEIAPAPESRSDFFAPLTAAAAAEPTQDDVLPSSARAEQGDSAQVATVAMPAVATTPGVTPQPAESASTEAVISSVRSAAGEDPSWNMTSYLGGVKIVPGSSVKLAQQEIAAAREVLQTGTWGAGNVAAGLVSLLPQVFLAQAAAALTTWQHSIEGVKSAYAETVGVPVIHELVGLALIGTMMVPSVATVALEAASLTVPWVGVLGAFDAAAQASQLVDEAQMNGLVYAVMPFLVGANSIQTGNVSINGGPWSPVQLDTGSSSLTTTNQYVGQDGLGPSTGTGVGSYGEGPTAVEYIYDSYTTHFNLPNRISTGPTTVNIAQPGISEQIYNSYTYADGVVGVLGLAANRGVGPNNIVTLPGELKNGVLLLQFGLWGLAVFGPNPLPVRASLPGAPDAYAQVQINDGPKQRVDAVFDSGGVYGSVPASVVGTGQTSGDLPFGTRISVYTGDGQTLLYSYTTSAERSTDVYEAKDFNTGNIPFQLGPVYFDYSQPDGIGTIAFSYL